MDPRSPVAATPASPDLSEPAHDERAHGAGLRNMQQLIELRWYAIVGQMATIGFVHFALGIELPLVNMLGIAGCLAAINLASLVFWRPRQEIGDLALLAGLLAAVGAMSARLYVGGDVSIAFVLRYRLRGGVHPVLVPCWASGVVVPATCAGVLGMNMFPGPRTMQANPARGIADPNAQRLLGSFLL